MSLPLGFFLAGIYKIFGDKNWYGIFILLSNLMFLLIIVQIINSYKNRAIRNTSIIVLGIVLPYLILNPTYTVTSILLSFSGLFLFLNTIKMENDKKSFYFLS
jgi:chromate transport protein ChrA